MGYSDYTFRDSNFFKRYFQRQRLNIACKAFKKTKKTNDVLNILDFGCGNAELYKYLKERINNFDYTGYDPSEQFIEEAKSNIGIEPNCKLFFGKDELINGPYDFIFCLEVFEHLPDHLIDKELNVLESLLNDNGYLVIGVPNEIYLSALIRGLFRMTRRFGKYDASIKNVFYSTLGMPPKDRHVTLNDTGTLIYAHMGFDYRSLIKKISNIFNVEEVFGGPIQHLPLVMNTEINIICRKLGKQTQKTI